jgi:hypothetical protein
MKKILAFSLIVLCAICIFISCNPPDTNDFVGTWAGMNSSNGYDYYYAFNSDKTYSLIIDLHTSTSSGYGNYSYTSTTLTLSPIETYSYTMVGKVLTLSGPMALTLTKQ